MVDDLHDVRKAGNAAAHQALEPTLADARQLSSLMAEFLSRIFVPEQDEWEMESADDMETEISPVNAAVSRKRTRDSDSDSSHFTECSHRSHRSTRQ
jgi:hypothetical protein